MNINTKISEATVKRIKEAFKDKIIASNNPYIYLSIKDKKMTINIFKKDKHGLYALTIGGKDNKEITSILRAFKVNEYKVSGLINEVMVTSKDYLFKDDQIGSDEVGTGDFFGPITVVATMIKKSDIARLKELGVTDSKKLSDNKIREIGKIAIKEFNYSSLGLDNKKYNEIVTKGMNMNEIKAKMHNRALSNLKKKFPNVDNIYVDQFVNSKKYYQYLKGEKILDGIVFHTKGESYFPSVALASIIARYSFLIKMDALNKRYKMTIPFGCNKKVEEFAIKFINKYGIEELNKIVKKDFKTYRKILDNLNK